ncbi:MAG TPA: bifunctional diaminohydroxyphosphoribosylaminopyrimidine deaminase/5-amino-6-(5-phosphoribosylamino)uracil reductase RibD [Gammaproteobacteria bacterium]|uniref:Riboflavin biosynthesis protein RibD n=1 Tax=OM182 bacterium TaxID=2510334 RepID=A0A520S3X9_9GAMM|nr:riboflavin biosynthesis protein RibD [Gammaproteobacteria bacterium]RPG42908.1 MAG: bifunctional diaminohydroxyphosphoribosylaminopyrimidine deaminase/5-amino-6-(5-phosphoribosylamino)uracil reductase RibD [Gammaproteobacteria bacterium TMED163]RZO77182.1 MAG: bifunctional diaminohydroxyphosphoribosylaminopyrimidine deaminase/5-amino-6-(5-phosphoribosylamino)uracil reductase RibD [OM182 bacterium]HAU25121.1 bifunctional diaminohydroxyphosphoribosylaminopyrimidine deaminase/5-amino-6-(5-phosph
MQHKHNTELDAAFLDWPVHMQRALDLADSVLTAAPNPRVGCVLVHDGQVISEGWHSAAGADHAEVMALTNAGRDPRGATAFVSLEPCAHHGKTGPCSDALIAAGIARVVIPMQDPNPEVAGKGIAKMEEAGIEVIMLPDFETAARRLNPGFFHRIEQGRPLVRMKLAMSLDGRTALANGASKWITDAASRADVQRLRAASSAVLTGVGTVLADDPSLNVRRDELGLSEAQLLSNELNLQEPPLRIVLDSRRRMPPTAKLLGLDGRVVVYSTVSAENSELLNSENVDLRLAGSGDRIDLQTVLESLAAEYQCNDVLIEAGPTLCGAFFQSKLVDELVVYIAPKLLGSDAKPLLDLVGITQISAAPEFQIIETQQVDNDVKLVLKPLANPGFTE